MRTRRAAFATLLTTLLIVALALPAVAAAGDLDHSFSGDGKLRVGISGGATDVVIQSDRKAVAVGEGGGDFAIVRLNRDGTLDHSFGGDGVVHIAGGPNRFDVANGVVVRNGKITVVGTSTRDSDLVTALALIRLNSDGTPDHSFHGNGEMVRATTVSGGLSALSVLGNGRILADGTTSQGQAGRQFLLEKYRRDGSFDMSFGGGDGVVVTGFKVGGQARDDAAL